MFIYSLQNLKISSIDKSVRAHMNLVTFQEMLCKNATYKNLKQPDLNLIASDKVMILTLRGKNIHWN